MTEDTAAVLLTGTVGAGKTALAVEMAAALESDGHTVAVIDLDWLGWIGGPDVNSEDITTLIQENLAALWGNIRKKGPTHLILCRFVASQEEIAGIRSALDGASLSVVRVTASPNTIEERLRRRDSGAELTEHLGQVEKMTQALDESRVAELVVETDGDLPDSAERALSQLEWKEKK
jgi:dephospho-CoA kinase